MRAKQRSRKELSSAEGSGSLRHPRSKTYLEAVLGGRDAHVVISVEKGRMVDGLPDACDVQDACLEKLLVVELGELLT